MAAIALIAITTLSALGLGRIVAARHDAERARAGAEDARHAAETQRAAAEDLVAFMLGDLRDRLEGLGRLELLEGVSAKVVDYYRALPTADGPELSPAGRRRADALAVYAEAKLSAGDAAGAIGPLRDAVTMLDAAAATPQVEVEGCLIRMRLADAERALGHADAAVIALEGCSALAHRRLDAAPGDPS
mgnify:CR=1 FL=1